MAKWRCPCGGQIRSSGDIPNPQEWHLVADVDVDDFASAASLPNDDDIRRFIELSRLVYLCDSCGRLHIFWGKTWPPSVYVLEPATYPGG